jgi:hypothetical protein
MTSLPATFAEDVFTAELRVQFEATSTSTGRHIAGEVAKLKDEGLAGALGSSTSTEVTTCRVWWPSTQWLSAGSRPA